MKNVFCVVVVLLAGLLALPSALQAETAQPVWALGKSPLKPKMITGDIQFSHGTITVDGENYLTLPSRVLGDQRNFTIEFEVCPPANNPSGTAISLCSNQDDEAKAGLRFLYFPPKYNSCWLQINTYTSDAKRIFDKEGFVKITLVVKDRRMMFFKDGLLMAMIGTQLKPSTKPLVFGRPKDPKRMPRKYTLRNIRIYDHPITPTGFDPSVERMSNYSGPGYRLDRVEIKDPTRPRILVIGDSISMGYRRYITEHYKGKAYVDYWVGGGWIEGPNSVLGKDSRVKLSWTGALSNGPYDVITWNPIGLHVWGPHHLKTRNPEAKYPQIINELIDHILSIKPERTTLVWVTTTPFCFRGRKKGEVGKIDREKSRYIVKFDGISHAVMEKHGIPEVDLWPVCEKNLDKVSGDGVHWSGDAYKLMAATLIEEIDRHLPKK